MAPSTKKAVEAVNEAPRVNESIYTAEELARNHKSFNTSYEIVTVALRLAGKKEATYSEANQIINKFKTKEVK